MSFRASRKPSTWFLRQSQFADLGPQALSLVQDWDRLRSALRVSLVVKDKNYQDKQRRGAAVKIVVVNGFITEAIGDAALLSVILEQLSSAFPHSEIQVSTLDDPAKHPYFEGYRNLGSSRRYGASEEIPRYRRAIRKLSVAIIGSHWPVGQKYQRYIDWLLPTEVRAEIKAIHDADLVVSVGGGYLYGQSNLSGDLAILNTLAPLLYAKRIGKLVFCGPQSYGPFGSQRQIQAARRTLGGADLLLAREAKSAKLLQEIGISHDSINQTIDSAFAFKVGDPAGWKSRLDVPEDQNLVGMTARQWKEPVLQEAQEAALAQLIDHIQAQDGRSVVLIPMVVSPLAGEDDRETHRRIASRCVGRQPIVIEEQLGHHEAKDLTSALDFMIGMRFHSVIFSLTNLVPSIAIEYHHKASGIMADLELDTWVVQFDELEGTHMIKLFEQLQTEEAEYRQHLHRVIPQFIAEADGVKNVFKSTYEAKISA
jgi:colanic acid/amylovoran biosynthesis protein